MKSLIYVTVLAVAGFFSPFSLAQTSPPNGWNAHLLGCFAADPTFANSSRGFERLATPANAQRVTTTVNYSGFNQQLGLAVWRQDCPNNPLFPVLMVRFETISGGAISLQNRDVELVQGATTTIAESIGHCSACLLQTSPFFPETERASFATMVVAEPRDPSLLFRNGFQFRFRGSSATVSIPATGSGGTGDLPLAGRLNGTYFDSARSGEGVLVDFFDAGSNKGVFLSWYTYDDVGNQMWLVGNATLAPGATTVDVPMIVTRGARFGPSFRPGDVQRIGWGTVTLRFPNCTTAVMNYRRVQDGQTGGFSLGRLGLASGVSC